MELSFTPFQGHFIKTLPLHASQEILIDNDKEVLIRLHVHATHDFQMEILSMLPEVRVLKPKFLRDEIAKKIRKAAEAIWPKYTTKISKSLNYTC